MPYKNPIQQKAAQQKWYEQNRNQYAELSKAQRMINRTWLNEQKDQPCIDCKGSYPPVCMDFHHRDPLTKESSVANLLLNAGRQRVIDEIAKCDLICANCHRIRTYQG